MTAPAVAAADTGLADGVEMLKLLSRARTDQVAVLSESTRQDWPPVSSRPELDIAITGSMSKASSFGLGLALARPDVGVWVLDTDGALLMNLGALVTIAAAKPPNLLHVVYDNGAYDTTGGQPTPGAGIVDFRRMALDAGYPRAFEHRRVADLEAGLGEILAGPFPNLLVLKIASRGRRPNMTMKRMVESFTTIRDYLAHHPTTAATDQRQKEKT